MNEAAPPEVRTATPRLASLRFVAADRIGLRIVVAVVLSLVCSAALVALSGHNPLAAFAALAMGAAGSPHQIGRRAQSGDAVSAGGIGSGLLLPRGRHQHRRRRPDRARRAGRRGGRASLARFRVLGYRARFVDRSGRARRLVVGDRNRHPSRPARPRSACHASPQFRRRAHRPAGAGGTARPGRRRVPAIAAHAAKRMALEAAGPRRAYRVRRSRSSRPRRFP